jgi:hypothetical protein
MKSVMSHSFSRVPTVNIPRSTFDRSHGHKTTFDGGYLIPFFIDEALPGDTLNLRTNGFARMSTPVYPVMDNMYMDTFFFSVPIRLVWDNFRKFMGEQVDPGDSIDYTVPQTAGFSCQEGELSDYFGLPLGTNLQVSSLFHRAYALIYNEWFRDQNLQDSVEMPTGDGPDTLNTHVGDVPLKRGKRHDYFTSCLPWPQKGDDVSLPLGTTAPVSATSTSGYATVAYSDGNAKRMIADSGDGYRVDLSNENNGSVPTLYTDLSSATAATINDLRESFQIQKLLEKDARGGTRYAEIVASHFGVNFVDATYRPEYLGGGSTPVNISPVASSYDDGTTKTAGELGAVGTAGFGGHGFVKSFTEHCIVMGIVNVRADLTYQKGINRMFSRSTRYDFYWPSLAQIGEQAVLNKEIYWQNGISADEDVFGYQERYAEYRYKPSQITGAFRSDAATSLDVWHLSEDFTALPTLSSTFIEDVADETIDRVIATPSEPQFIADFYFDYKCARPMPLFGTPGLIDHF